MIIGRSVLQACLFLYEVCLSLLKGKYEENTKIKIIYLNLFSLSYFSNTGKSDTF